MTDERLPTTVSADMREHLKRTYPPPKSQWAALVFIAPALLLVLLRCPDGDVGVDVPARLAAHGRGAVHRPRKL